MSPADNLQRQVSEIYDDAGQLPVVVRLLSVRPNPSQAELRIKDWVRSLLEKFVRRSYVVSTFTKSVLDDTTMDTLLTVDKSGLEDALAQVRQLMRSIGLLEVTIIAVFNRNKWLVVYPAGYTRKFVPGTPWQVHEHPSLVALLTRAAAVTLPKELQRLLIESRATAPASGAESEP